MESCLYALLLLASAASLVGGADRVRIGVSAVLLALAALARPEAAALCPVMLVLVYWTFRSFRHVVLYAATFGICFGPYFSARALHYGQLFPNTFYAKLDYGSVLLWRRGLAYVWDFGLATSPIVLLSLIGIALFRKAPLWVRGFALLAVAQSCLVAYEGGDHFAMYRFMVPVLPFIALLALYPCAAITNRYRLSASKANIAAIISMAAIAFSGLSICKQIKRDEPATVRQFGRFLQEVDCARQWTEIGQWLRQNAPADASLATIAIGAVGYFSELRLVDPYGIIDPWIAHQKRRLGGGYAGHEKHDVDRVLAQRPCYLLIVNNLTHNAIPEDAIPEALWGDFNRALYADPRLEERYRYVSIPVGQRWLNLHVRRDLPAPGRDRQGIEQLAD
jgi:hypothetical protein